MSYFFRLGCLFGALLVVGCSSDSGSDADESRPNVDAGTGGAGGTEDAGGGQGAAPSLDPYTGDCSTARWADMPEECWNCFCNRCKDTLNACNEGCVKGIACSADKHVLVGDPADIQCELRAFGAACASDPDIAPEVTPLTTFDTCLIASHKAPEMLRACEKECNVTYTGDVCTRYPAPDGG